MNKPMTIEQTTNNEESKIDLKTTIVVGEDQEGELYIASTTANLPMILYWIKRAECFLMAQEVTREHPENKEPIKEGLSSLKMN